MATLLTQQYNLNLIPGQNIVVVNAAAYDNSPRLIRFNMFNGAVAADISGWSARVEGTRQGTKAGFSTVCTVASPVVSFAITDAMTASSGKHQAAVVFYQGEERVASATFILNVAPAVLDESTPATEEDATIYQQWLAANTSQIQANANEISVLKGRMDEFASLPPGSTEGNAELVDIRVGYDGTTYPTAGDAVRNQVTDLKTVITSLETSLENGDFDYNVGINIFDGRFPQSGGISNATGEDLPSVNAVRTGYIPIDSSNSKLYCLRQSQPYSLEVRFYSINNPTGYLDYGTLFTASNTLLKSKVNIPSGANYVRFIKQQTATGYIEISYTNEDTYTPYNPKWELSDYFTGKFDEIAQLENDITAKKVFNIFDGSFPESGYFDANGVNASSSTYKRTAYIDVDASNGTLYLLRTAQPYILVYCFYDSNGTGIGRSNAFRESETALSKALTIPSNAKKLRMYTRTADYSGNLMLSYKPYTSYIPYGERFVLADALVDEDNLTPELKEKVNSGAKLSGKTIAFMGDSIIGNFYDATGVCALLAEKTGATAINCAFGGSRMAYRYGSNIQYTYWNALSGAGLADAIASGSWTAQDTAVANMTGGLDYFAERLAQVKAVDWSTVDFIMWEYGTNDFMTEVKLDGADLYAYNHAYRHAIETILTAYPNIRIIPVTPIYRWYQSGGEYTEDSNTHLQADYAGVQTKLIDFVAMAQTISKEYQLACIDDYYTLGANRYTRFAYFNSTDGTHPNENGRLRIAEHIAGQLESLV